MMSLYAKYIQERTERQILEVEHGFATYEITSDYVYIVDVYVETDYRRSGIAFQLADSIADIAMKKGINKMLTSVVPSTKGSTDSMKAILAYGFILDSATNNFIVLKKDLKGV